MSCNHRFGLDTSIDSLFLRPRDEAEFAVRQSLGFPDKESAAYLHPCYEPSQGVALQWPIEVGECQVPA